MRHKIEKMAIQMVVHIFWCHFCCFTAITNIAWGVCCSLVLFLPFWQITK